MTSGSTKYTFGAAFGPKSRGGVVITLGGSTGFAACASTAPGARNVTPAAAATVLIAVRLEIGCSCAIGPSPGERHCTNSGPFVPRPRPLVARGGWACRPLEGHGAADDRHVDGQVLEVVLGARERVAVEHDHVR